ncbi:MAG: hypothetical protein KIT22_07895 [Verrucomicrobiae bacterium]|nr:hypothetical protein [Verrucomicrobiae bacterium]
MLTEPQPFDEAIRARTVKRNLPTSLSSRELMRLGADARERANLSARQTREDVLDQIAARVRSILDPQVERRADRITDLNPEGRVTTGDNFASARLKLAEFGRSIGYQPEPGKRGTIEDHFSGPRLNLILETNVRMAQGYGYFAQGNTPEALELYPCWELFRAEDRVMPRDWESRWYEAAEAVGDTDAARSLREQGRMVARKDSPIWESLSAFGQPYPPFDFNSGMDVQDVDRDTAVELGVIRELDVIRPQSRPFDLAA